MTIFFSGFGGGIFAGLSLQSNDSQWSVLGRKGQGRRTQMCKRRWNWPFYQTNRTMARAMQGQAVTVSPVCMSNHCLASYDDAHDDGGGGSARNASRFVTPLTEEIFKNRSALVRFPQTLGGTKITIEFRSRSDVRYAIIPSDRFSFGRSSGIKLGRACSCCFAPAQQRSLSRC
jgi:hypothetical protein